ncbi:hypothetical protein EVG20_g1691 [Dentipellis fragilis]|uniref:Magnesium transporter n=1 Tax=Dentipellis fragilis TaxID=205917 RepID=A0A4Y9ZBX2_9AGAM|nr:hypothetical protein EVG20_g1691 [Dentipellis fragilis]
MVEDKYIGLALAMASSLAIGTSFIITKKGLNDAAERNSAYASASEDYAYLKNPIWWAGMSTLVLGELANFAAYSFAPPILVTPLGALSVIIGAILASYLLKEELGHLGRLGCTMCLIGSLIIVLHAPEDKDVQTVDEILHYAIQPGFLMYCLSVLIFTLVMIYSVAPRYGRSNPIVYVSICSVVGSVSIMAIKGFGVAVKLTFAGNNQFTHPSTYVFGIIVAFCIMIQMNYFNKALDTFSTNVVNPMYYVLFSTATIVASLILFQGFNTDNPTNTISLIAGFVVTFLGIHLLELSRKPEAPITTGHTALDGGVMNPRLSLQGNRPSLDGWAGPPGTPGLAGVGHARRSSRTSLYRSQTATLFNAFEDDAAERGDAVGLRPLDEDDGESDDDELEAANERTRLRGKNGSRSHSHSHSPRGSPVPGRGS